MSQITFTLDGLEELVAAIVRQELERLQIEAQERWYTAAEAAAYLRVSVQRIHDLVHQGRLPRHGGRGQALRFQRGDLDGCVRNGGERQ